MLCSAAAYVQAVFNHSTVKDKDANTGSPRCWSTSGKIAQTTVSSSRCGSETSVCQHYDSDLWTLYQIGVRQCRSGHGGTARQRCHQPTQLVLLLQTYVKLHKVT